MLQENGHGARARYVVVFVGLVIGAALVVLDPILYGRMVDVIVNGLRGGDASVILPNVTLLIILWVGVFIFNTGLNIVLRYILWSASNILGLNFACAGVHDMLSWSRQRFSRYSTGRIIKVFDQAWDSTFWLPSELFEGILPSLLSFAAVVVAGFILDWRLTLISFAMLPVSVILGVAAWKKARVKQEWLDDKWADLSRHVGESIGNITVVQNFAQEMRRERTFVQLMRDNLRKQLRMNVFWALFHGLENTLTLFGRAIVFVAGVVMVAHGTTTLGTLVTFLGMLNYLLGPLEHVLGSALPRFSRGISRLSLYAKLVDEHNDVVEHANARSLRVNKADVRLIGVRFTYLDQQKPTLRGVDLHIPSGTSCALVGPSGAGKSTISKLINRVVDPTRGRVEIDGQDVRDVTLRSLRRAVGVVTQETFLFHDTILNNVRFVRPSASRDDVIRACTMAQAHGFIRRLPKGYDSIVGERGVKLSGGERQRLALARIFLADPPILVLDESTSALDSETEARIQATLKEAMKGRTTIIIAHRLSTVYLADQIVVVERGRIVDIGTHEELITKGGLYDRLWSMQAGGYIA